MREMREDENALREVFRVMRNPSEGERGMREKG